MTLVESLVVVAIIGVLIALAVPAVQRARDASLRARCLNNLRQIGIGIHQYHDSYGFLPPGVSYQGGAASYPFMSWNTRILPYIEQEALWKVTIEAFAQDPFFRDNPPHLGLDTVMPVYGCPADPRTLEATEIGGGIRVAFTAYLGVEGTNQFRKDGLLYLDSQVRFGDVTDGLSNTLLVGERPPSADLRFGWWYGGWGQNQDGSGEMVLGVQERNFGAWNRQCPRGPYVFGPGQMGNQCDMFHFWSPHIGGAHFLLADGSGHFLNYLAAPLLPALATRAGGESTVIPD